MKLLKIRSFAILIILLPMLYACPKSKNIAPEPDTELQSSVDAIYASFLVSDIEMIAGFIGENDYQPAFYVPEPLENPAKFQAYHQTSQDYKVAFYDSPTSVKCMDGHSRRGSIYLKYEQIDPNAHYYQNYQFHGKITLSDYHVDGWLIRTVDGLPCDVYNELSSPVFDRKKTKLSWKIKGSFEFIHPTDASKNMIWTGELTKTLANTNDPLVYNANRLVPIDWTMANVEYTGKATGYISGDVPFVLEINQFKPLTREFACYPNEVGGILTTQPLKTWKNEFHPFKSGVIDFTPDGKYPRVIYFGNEGIAGSEAQCDNSGMVLIKGNSYVVDFK